MTEKGLREDDGVSGRQIQAQGPDPLSGSPIWQGGKRLVAERPLGACCDRTEDKRKEEQDATPHDASPENGGWHDARWPSRRNQESVSAVPGEAAWRLPDPPTLVTRRWFVEGQKPAALSP